MPLRFFRKYAFLIIASAVLLLSFTYSWQYSVRSMRGHSQIKFQDECQRIKTLIENRLELYINGLYGAQALFASSRSVERDEWHVYVESQHLTERYPGIAALRFIERVPAADKAAFIESVQKDTSLDPSGYPDFTIHPSTDKPEYFVVKYVEPTSPDSAMLGLDAGFELARLAALERARDSAMPQATGKITLFNEGKTGFLIALPIYRNAVPHATLEERKAALVGYVDAAFRAEEFFPAVFQREKFPSSIDCEVFDGNSSTQENMLYDFNPSELAVISRYRSSFRAELTLVIAGRTWTLYFSALPGFGLGTAEKRFPLFIFFGGLLSGIFMFLLGVSRTKEISLEATVDKRTRELNKAHAVIEQSEKMAALGQMAAGLTHEINNPLGVIIGFSQSVLKRIPPGDGLEMPLKSIETEAVRCRQLVQDVLGFSRTEKTAMGEIDLSETVESAVSLVIAQAKTKSVEFLKEFQAGLPKVTANRNQILQVVINLSSNAIDAMPKGGKLILRTLGAEKDGKKEAEIQVQDSGEGIRPEILQTIFEPFFTTKEAGKGTGLGLSLVYDIVVNKHKGRIDVQSQVGKGTTFYVRLPMAPSAIH